MNILKTLKQNAEDLEWYPTTQEIIDRVTSDLYEHRCYRDTICDYGAGDGRVLKAISKELNSNSAFGVEQSSTLRSKWDDDITFAGVRFENVDFASTSYGVIFSNPPYSEYSEWANKILSQSGGNPTIYLVLPDRWQNSVNAEGYSFEILGDYNFEEAERVARCKVQLIRFKKDWREAKDPFESIFDSLFSFPELPIEEAEKEEMSREERKRLTLSGENFIDSAITEHNLAMEDLCEDIRGLCRINPRILAAFDLSKEAMIKIVKEKSVVQLENSWRKIFFELDSLRDVLTTKKRKHLFDKLLENENLSFNKENILAVIEWMIKWAALYMDEQFIDTYEHLLNHANAEAYKSNFRIFKEEDFRYSRYDGKEWPQAKLKAEPGYRMVIEWGGLNHGTYAIRQGLSQHGADLISDILTVAKTMGYSTIRNLPNEGAWKTSAAEEFPDADGNVLLRVRAYKNRNLHMQFNENLVRAFNARYGKLKGWVTSAKESIKEFGVEDIETNSEALKAALGIGLIEYVPNLAS